MDGDEPPIGIAASRAIAKMMPEEISGTVGMNEVCEKASEAFAQMTPEQLTGEGTCRRAETERIKYQKTHALEIFQREQLADKLAAHKRLGGIRDVSIAGIEERLAKGDAIINGEGEIVGYRPVRLRELDNLLASVIDRQIALEKRILGENEGGASPIPGSVTNLLERLELLAKANPIKGKVAGEYREPKVIDVEAGD